MGDLIWWTHPTYFTSWTCLDHDSFEDYGAMCNQCNGIPPPPRLRRMNAMPHISNLDDVCKLLTTYHYVEHVEITNDIILDRKNVVVWVNMISIADNPLVIIQTLDRNPLSKPEKRTKIVRDMLSDWMGCLFGLIYSAKISECTCTLKSVPIRAIILDVR